MKLKYKYLIILLFFIIVYIIYKLLNLYIKYKTFQTSLKISFRNNLFCTKFEPPCDITINDKLYVPINISEI